MGKPTAGNAAVRHTEQIGVFEQTLGSETSQYQEEKKTSSDSVSSGERKRISPNRVDASPPGVAGPGGDDPEMKFR